MGGLVNAGTRDQGTKYPPKEAGGDNGSDLAMGKRQKRPTTPPCSRAQLNSGPRLTLSAGISRCRRNSGTSLTSLRGLNPALRRDELTRLSNHVMQTMGMTTTLDRHQTALVDRMLRVVLAVEDADAHRELTELRRDKGTPEGLLVREARDRRR